MKFCSNQIKAYCKSQDIARHYIIPYISQQNGVAKRLNRTFSSKAHCMLSNLGLNRHFWVKIASATIKYIFISYQSDVKGYKLWNLHAQIVALSNNDVFNESTMLPDNLSIY
jgi:hypothetical protein